MVTQLEEMLRRAAPELTKQGTMVFDEATFQNHYDALLTWTFRFISRTECGSEIENCQVVLSIVEDEPTTCSVWTRAEVFQLGQVSRREKTDVVKLSMDEVRKRGVVPVILAGIREGREFLSRLI